MQNNDGTWRQQFEFRFRSIIPLGSMDDRAEAEFKIAVAKYHQSDINLF